MLNSSPTEERGIIDRARAKALLAANTGNRKLRARKVALYENILRDGQWRLTSDAVAISVSGRLINGQHRLQAIVNTGIPAELLIVTGLPDDSQLVIDRGARRTTSDALVFCGMKFSATAARVAKSLMPLIFRKTEFTDVEVAEHVHNWQVTYDWLASTQVAKDRISAPVLAALAYAHAVRPNETEVFAQKMAHPAELRNGHPVLAAIRISQEKAGDPSIRRKIMLRILRCLHLHCEGETVSSAQHVIANQIGLDYFGKLHEHGNMPVSDLLVQPARRR